MAKCQQQQSLECCNTVAQIYLTCCPVDCWKVNMISQTGSVAGESFYRKISLSHCPFTFDSGSTSRPIIPVHQIFDIRTDSISQCCCPWPWDVLEDKFWVLGLEVQVLGRQGLDLQGQGLKIRLGLEAQVLVNNTGISDWLKLRISEQNVINKR